MTVSRGITGDNASCAEDHSQISPASNSPIKKTAKRVIARAPKAGHRNDRSRPDIAIAIALAALAQSGTRGKGAPDSIRLSTVA